MNRILGILLISLIYITQVTSQIPRGFKSIFNGKNLKGWHVSRSSHQGTVLNPQVKDRSIVLHPFPFGQGGILLTDKKYTSFELYIEVKIDSFSNGGIFLRSNEGGAAYQIEMALPGSHCHLFGERIPCSVPGVPQNIEALWKTNDWNKIKIRMVGEIPKIKVWLNAMELYSVQQTKNDFIGGDIKGSIGLQCHWSALFSETAGKGMPLDIWRPGMYHRYRNIGIKIL